VARRSTAPAPVTAQPAATGSAGETVGARPAVIGAHVPAAGGLARTGLPYLDACAARVAQVFVSNPRGWRLTAGDAAQDEAFTQGCQDRGVPTYVHASLLVNLGSPTDETVENSRATLEHALVRAREIGARAVVFHAGSAVDASYHERALRRLREVLLPLLDQAASVRGPVEHAGPGGGARPRLLVEPSAGGGHSLAARVEDLGAYFDAVDWHPALGVCFDTCHVWAAGHDLATTGGMTTTLDALITTVGEGRLALVHANDSQDTCGSRRDRHMTIGAGTIGLEPFAELLRHPSMTGVPLVVETPSTGYTGHAADIATLTRLSESSEIPESRRTGRSRNDRRAPAGNATKPSSAARSSRDGTNRSSREPGHS
jgi:deoxyribonuclease-4